MEITPTPANAPADTLLFEIPGLQWNDADAARARHAMPDAPVDILTAVSEPETWIYVPAHHVSDSDRLANANAFIATLLGTDGDSTPTFRLRRLRGLLSIGEAAAGARQSWHYTSQTDIPTAIEEEFNRWFDEEHLPRLAAVPGTVHAARYRTDGSPRYLASYDLTQQGVQGSDTWRTTIATPWRDRIHHEFVNPRRLMLKRLC